MKEAIEIKQNFFKQIKLVLLGLLLMFVCCYGIVGTFDTEYHKGRILLLKLACVAGLLYFTMPVLFLIYRLLNPKPIFIINKDGIINNSAIFSIKFIPWNNIKKMYVFKYKKGGQKLFIGIGVDVKNKNELIKNLKWIHKKIIHWNKKLSFPTININLSNTKYKPDEILKIMQEYKAEYDRLHKAKKINNDD